MLIVGNQHDGVAHGDTEQGNESDHGADGQGLVDQEHGDHAADEGEREVGQRQEGVPQTANGNVDQYQNDHARKQGMQQQFLFRRFLLDRSAGELGKCTL